MLPQFEPTTREHSGPQSSRIKIWSEWRLQRSISLSSFLLIFRWVVVACQAASLLITWPLWDVHASPPMLPAVPLPAFDLGIPLLASLALILVLPVPGMTVHSALLIYAFLIDQTRIQPEFFSLAFLMWGSLPNPTARAFARAHLISLWFFAGLHKLFSPTFVDDTAPWIISVLPFTPGRWLDANIGYVLALTELSLGVLAFIPRTRMLSAFLAFIVHAGILYIVLPTGHNLSFAIWPWNAALALSGFALILPWKSSLFKTVLECRKVARLLIILLVVAPLGFYVGVTPTNLSYHMWSSSVPLAYTKDASDASSEWTSLIERTRDPFTVPLPPDRRVFHQLFQETCQPGDQMIILDTRWWYRVQGLEQQQFSCPNAAG